MAVPILMAGPTGTGAESRFDYFYASYFFLFCCPQLRIPHSRR